MNPTKRILRGFTTSQSGYYDYGSQSDPRNPFHELEFRNLSQNVRDNAYNRGFTDGSRDKEVELIRMGKALMETNHQSADTLSQILLEEALKNNITIHEMYFNLQNWDKISLLVIVKMEDYIDDRIDTLYAIATSLLESMNSNFIQFEYTITYLSETLNRQRILSDGFTHVYEFTPPARTA